MLSEIKKYFCDLPSDFEAENKIWQFAGRDFSRTQVVLFCVVAVSILSFHNALFLWAGLGIWAAGQILGIFKIRKDASVFEKQIKKEEEIDLFNQISLENENKTVSGKSIKIISSVISAFVREIENSNTVLSSRLFSNLGGIVHVCITTRVTPTPQTAC